MELTRYSLITGKNAREMVLLKAHPCKWGKCTFCDYILDNSADTGFIVAENKEILKNVTGAAGVLDVIDSASCFDLPEETLADIKRVVKERHIQKMYTECHYMYRNKLAWWRNYFGVETVFRCGVETFDNDFRNKVLCKGAYFSAPEEVAAHFDSVCLLVGIKGQTKDMIRRDVEILKRLFRHGCINIFVPNSTKLEPDPELIRWFRQEYGALDGDPDVEVLWNNTDLGVG